MKEGSWTRLPLLFLLVALLMVGVAAGMETTETTGNVVWLEPEVVARRVVLPFGAANATTVAVPRAAAVLQALVEHHGDRCSVWFRDMFLGIFAPFRARFLAASGHGNSEFTAVLTSLLSMLTHADGV